jgi:Na+-translocating ferredoxin:NAD+ oxidoreductase subunit B
MARALFDAALIVGGIGLFCGIVLSFASRFFGVREDERVEAVLGMLPGSNCGACGYTGCLDYAKAIVLQGAKVIECKPGGAGPAREIAAFMGVEAEAARRMAALVLCGGDDARASRKFLYNGVADCAAAALVGGGDKACGYGCLGLGTCARVCPVQAIEITGGRLAVVHPELCIGCGLCVAACPRRLIKLVPEAASVHVLCKSPERGASVRKKCSVGCIGCALCTKQTDAIAMDGALAVVDYDKLPANPDEVVAKCPQGTIVRRTSGKAEAAA